MKSDAGMFVEGLIVFLLCGLLASFTSGCSFKVEALYHGETPIGLDNRQATQIRATVPETQERKKY